MIVKLNAGQIESNGLDNGAEMPSDIPASLECRALLVYCGKFNSMEGPVEITANHLNKIVDNHNSLITRMKTLLAGNVPLRHYPPVQLDHSSSAKDTVGRVTGSLSHGDHRLADGSVQPAIYGSLKVLGRENVEKIMDGRWSHLSIGADLDTGHLSELTITPFPAAPEASLLSRGQSMNEEVVKEQGEYKVCSYTQDNEAKFKVYYQGKILKEGLTAYKQATDEVFYHSKNVVNMSAETTNESTSMGAAGDIWMEKEEREKLKKYLKEHKKMSDDDAESHMAKCDQDKEEHKKLAAEHDEHEKKMSAESSEEDKKEKEDKEKKMTAAKESLTKLSAAFGKQLSTAKLAAAQGKIALQLSRLRAAGKITPAEIKKIDVVKMAAGPQATADAVLKSYEDREPVILVGQYGSTKAEDLSKVEKASRMSALEEETRANMSLLKNTVKMKEDKNPSERQQVHAEVKEQVDAVSVDFEKQLSTLNEAVALMQAEYESLHKLASSFANE